MIGFDEQLEELTEDCIHCHACQYNCDFLLKYQIDVGDIEDMTALAYHCFLCDRCKEVCPVDISGRDVSLTARQKRVSENAGQIDVDGFGMTIAEKSHYPFKNYRKARTAEPEGTCVVFVGCNVVGLYPNTVAACIDALSDTMNVGVAYDCCGAPLQILGLEDDYRAVIADINRRLHEAGANEVVCLCPTCAQRFEADLDIPVTNIYAKFHELGIGKPISEAGFVHIPCSDRPARTWYASVKELFEQEPSVSEAGQCCGLGGCGWNEEPEISSQMAQNLYRPDRDTFVYCASCAGAMMRNIPETEHGRVRYILSELLDMDEYAQTSTSFINKAKAVLR